jgi:DNA-binding IclR family transcriptional regulator
VATALRHLGALLLEGRVEQDRRRGTYLLVERIAELLEALAGASIPSPKMSTASGAMLRIGRGRRAR